MNLSILTVLVTKGDIVSLYRDVSGGFLDKLESRGYKIEETWITPPTTGAITRRMGAM